MMHGWGMGEGVLKRRYARGEISREEFMRIREELKS